MNLFLRECKANLKSFCFWCAGIIFLILISSGKTTSMVGQDNAGLNELLQQLPKSVQTIFGVGVVDYSTAIGVFSIVFTYIALIAAFHAVTLGVSAFGKEERDKTFEFLYVKGKTRNFIFSSKVASSVVQIILLNLISYLASVVSVNLILGDNIAGEYLPLALGMFFIQIIFFGLGLLFSLLCTRMKTAGSLGMTVVLVTFLLCIASDFSENLTWLRYVTPFKYFDGKEMVTAGASWSYGGVCAAVAAACVLVSYWLHEKRDLHC